MSEILGSRRMAELSYGAWKREEIVWRTRVWGSEIGLVPVDQVTDDDCHAFIHRQKRLEPQRDKAGQIQLYEPAEDGLPDLDRPLQRDGRGRAIRERVKGRKTARPKPVSLYVESFDALTPIGLKRVATCISPYFDIAKAKPFRYIKANPMLGIEYPRRRRQSMAKKRVSLTPEQAANFNTNLLKFRTGLFSQGARFEAMVMTLLNSGVRRGEICGLLRENVKTGLDDKAERVWFLCIDNARIMVPGGTRDAATKTGATGNVYIPEETYDMILALPARRDPDTGNVYAFSAETGRPVRPDNFSRSFRQFRNAIGMPKLRMHHLRHTYISLMLRAGVDLKTIQANVRHSTPRMILEIYGETFDQSQSESVGAFMKLLAEARKESARAVIAQ